MIENLFIFAISIFLIIKGATLSTKYSFRIAENFKISKYVIGFIMVAVISVIPETFISINAAIEGVPSLALGTLFGSNIADLTLVFAIIIFFSRRSIKIESKILKENIVYPFFLLIPIVLGFDGFYSRWEGLVLIIAGLIFYYLAFKNNSKDEEEIADSIPEIKTNKKRDFYFLVVSLAALLIGSHFVVTSAINIAGLLKVSSAVIGMLAIGIGTTMPELFFCLSAVKNNHDSLAIGDILGTVLADATILVGFLALINPFSFPQKTIYIAGIFMVASSFLLFFFMRTGKSVSKNEGYLLFFFWLVFALVEITLNS